MKRLLPLLLILLLLLSACGAQPAGEGGQSPSPAAETAAPESPAPDRQGLDEDELPIMTENGAAAPSVSPAPTGEAAPAPALSGTELTLDGLSSYLRVTLPEGWTWAQAGGTPGGTVYGLWPESDPDFKVELRYWPEKFAMCGTGVTMQDYTLPNGQKAVLAYEMLGEEISWVLILPEAPDSFTIQFAVPYALYENHRAELELLLGTIRQGVRADLDVVTPETSAD